MTGAFSGLNNLTDISLERDFGAVAGFTQEELEKYFSAHIEAAAKELGIPTLSLIDEFKQYYYGFSFDGITNLYNPYSVVLFFEQNDKAFKPFWMRSGSSQVIRDKLAEWNVRPDSFQGQIIGRETAQFPGEINQDAPALFLYQAGYLTLRKKDSYTFILDYPNTEVRMSMNRLFIENFCRPERELNLSVDFIDLKNSLLSGSLPEMIAVLNRCLSDVSWQLLMEKSRLFLDSNSQEPIGSSEGHSDDFKVKKTKNQPSEYVFQSILQILFIGAGFKASIESQNITGRSDLVIYPIKSDLPETAAVIELKIKSRSQTALKVAEAGFKQILSRGYGEMFENPILISLALDASSRLIAAGVFKKDGKMENWLPKRS
jgi:hypothetical protein